MKQRALYVLLLSAILLFAINRAAALFHKLTADSKEVVIYTTEWCPYCNSLRIHLSNHAVPYIEHDVEKSIAGVTGFWALRARGVPVSVVGPDVIYGYNIEKFNLSLENIGFNGTLFN